MDWINTPGVDPKSIAPGISIAAKALIEETLNDVHWTITSREERDGRPARRPPSTNRSPGEMPGIVRSK